MNVKAGDLAILIKSTTGKNIGSICTVLEFVGTVPYPDMTLHNMWRVEFTHDIPVDLLGHDGKFYTVRQKKALAADDWLKPISGLDDEDHTEDDIIKEIECEILT